MIVPHDKLENTVGRGLEEALCGILAPYDEGTEEPAYLTFHDMRLLIAKVIGMVSVTWAGLPSL